MDLQHWQNLYGSDYTAIYLLPRKKWNKVCTAKAGSSELLMYQQFFSASELERLEYSFGVGRQKFVNMTKKQIVDLFWPRALELLRDPSYDLKDYEDGS